MDNVLFGLGFLSLAGVIAFLVIAVVRIFKKKTPQEFCRCRFDLLCCI